MNALSPVSPESILPSETDLPRSRELSARNRALFFVLCLLTVAGMFVAMWQFWLPGHPGVDQNGYLFGARQFAAHASMGYVPPDPYSYVGAMWVGSHDLSIYYPKYPLGLPFLYACLIKVGGIPSGLTWCYLLSPVCMALAMVGAYLLMRRMLRPMESLVGMLVLMCSPVTLALWNNPNSHASCLTCVCWGMWLLTGWWQLGNRWRAIGAGLLLGYAATIRYSEGLLLLPILLAVVMPWTGGWVAGLRSRWRQALLMICCWALPLAVVVGFNLAWFGTVTGYDPTHESTGFALKYFVTNWQTAVRQLNTTGLIFLLPVCLMGLVLLVIRRPKWGAMLGIWVVPNLLLYSFYYWAPDTASVGYLRFFLTIFPGLILCGIWLVTDVGRQVHLSIRQSRWCAALMAGLSAMIVSCVIQPPLILGMTPDDDPTWRMGALGICLSAGVIVGIGVALVMFRKRDSRLSLADSMADPHGQHQSAGRLLTLWLAGGTSAALCLLSAMPMVDREYCQQLLLVRGTQEVMSEARPGDVIFADTSMINHLQFVGDWHLYTLEAYNRGSLVAAWDRVSRLKEDDPNPRQMQRLESIANRVGPMTPQQLLDEQGEMIRHAIEQGHQVFLVGPRRTVDPMRRTLPAKAFAWDVKTRWNDASPRIDPAVAARALNAPNRAQSKAAMAAADWELVRVTLVEKPTQPTSRPAPASR